MIFLFVVIVTRTAGTKQHDSSTVYFFISSGEASLSAIVGRK